MSPGTEHTAIWPFGFVSLYTIVSLREASLQDFAGSLPATGGLIAAPGPLLAPSLSPFFLWLGVLLSFRIGQRRDLEFHDQIQVLLDQCERVACRLSNLFR